MAQPQTQPICERCWFAMNPQNDPKQTKNTTRETCSYCSQPTVAGIYVLADPEVVPFKQKEKKVAEVNE